MENVSRDNLINQLEYMLGEIKQRPKGAYFAVPEISISQIDDSWMRQVHKSGLARALKLQKRLKKQKDNI